ncbi:MAG TPA: hypothetical protein VMT88_07495 [Actinomycetes bacterium]|nr:hypothetical protein [Actinomycetes bacterium]
MMTIALVLMTALALVGAFDTLYYHEYRGRLPARPEAAPELRLHAARDAVYFIVFTTLPWMQWQGALTLLLGLLFITEIVITVRDFVVEDSVRLPQGGVFPGERVTHAVMGVIYGAMLANLVPSMVKWADQPTGIDAVHYALPEWWLLGLILLGVGTLLSGLRDLYAAAGLPGGALPWSSDQVQRTVLHHA